jgi:hypothetical protein
MSVEKKIDELVLSYLKRAEGRTAIMSPQDIAKIVRDAAHQGAMMGYDAGMKMARHSHAKDLEIAENLEIEISIDNASKDAASLRSLETSNYRVQIRITNPIYKDSCKEIARMSPILNSIGCPILVLLLAR